MQEKQPLHLGERVYMIDGFDLGKPSRTGIYVLLEEELTLIETGPSPSVPYILEGLAKLGLAAEQIKYIIVTHIHLDHAGGAGVLLEHCPEAKVVVHEKGARHLADPSRLIAGARVVYGDTFDSLFNPILPIPEERLLIKKDGETLTIGPERTLEFLNTPGHANHHFCIYDSYSKGMFTGDTAGIYYAQLAQDGLQFFLPTTSPNQFDPAAMFDSLNRIRERQLDKIYFSHFGVTQDVNEALQQVSSWIPRFVEEAKEYYERGKEFPELATRLLELVRKHLQQCNVNDDHEVYQILELDMHLCAMGLFDYLQKNS